MLCMYRLRSELFSFGVSISLSADFPRKAAVLCEVHFVVVWAEAARGSGRVAIR